MATHGKAFPAPRAIIVDQIQAKKNRSDGSFATADLFEKHPTIENAWFYHSRADSQLTLITGKKFDPAPLEAAIATSENVDDVLIFGDQRPYPGVLLLRSEKSTSISDMELRNTIWPRIDKLNRESQDHARIPQHMLVPIQHQDEPLEKSSKGTIIRRAVETRFAKYIDAAYEDKEQLDSQDIADEKLSQYLIKLVQFMIQSPDPPAEETDLFSYGVDSIACMKLRSKLRQLTPNYNQELPFSIVEDCGTIRDLSNYVLRRRHGSADDDVQDEKKLMLDLVNEYGDFGNHMSKQQEQWNDKIKDSNGGEVILLTGATGALGAHVLSLLRSSSSVSAIYCLVRGADCTAAKERVSKALSQRGLPDLSSQFPFNGKIKILQAQLGELQLGLPSDMYSHLAANVTSILHIAWTVNFRLKLRSFARENIAGVRHLLDLALAQPRATPPRFAYCSSTAAIINGQADAEGRLPERIDSDPAAASSLGYSRSKWVAEHICLAAHGETELKDRVTVVRVGQLAGDSGSGVWNTKEAWPMMLSTASLIQCLPDLRDEPLDWLPVDVAAKAFLQASSTANLEKNGECGVFHVLNPHQTPTWRDMLAWLRVKAPFEVVPPEEWIRRLERCQPDGHSSMKLLGLWKEAYGDGQAGKDKEGPGPKFSVEETRKRVEAIRDVGPLNEEYVGKIWDWVQANVQ